MLADGALSAGHARAIVSTSDPVRLARKIADEGLSVRDAEKLAQKDAEQAANPGGLETKSAGRADDKDADTLALERSLSDVLGLKVQLAHKGQGGQLRIEYKSLEQLDELCRLLGDK